MSLSVTLNEINYSIPEEQESGYGLTLTTYLSDLAEYLQNGYLANVGQRIKLNTNATSGTINNLNTNNQSFIRLTNANTLTGIGNVQIGKFVHLINASNSDIEIPNEDSGSDLNNQILTTDGNSFYLVPNGIASFYYDSSETKWRLINSSSLINEKYVVDSTSGVIESLNTTNRTFIRLTEATEVNTLASPLSGKRILLLNDTGETITLKHNTGTTEANRISVSNGFDFILEDKNYTQLIYNPNSSRWEIIGKDSITRDNISINTTVGAIHNLDIAKISAIKFTQATELTGFNSNEDGREIIIFNDNATPLTIKNQSTDSTETNRIITDTNADITIRQYGTVIFKYDSDSERWKIQSRTIDDSGYDSKYERLVNKGANNGYASLGAGGKIPVSQIDLSFLNLNDTPNSFTGQKSKVVKVKSDETGLEFGNATDSSNYLEFPIAIDNPTNLGWITYQDTSQYPVDGQGGSANIYWTQNTTDPLSGIGDFQFYKVANNRQGDGASTEFEIEKRHLGKVLQIEFDACLRSGTYVDGDIGVFIIADPNGTPQLIVPDNFGVAVGTLGNSNKFIGNFQTLLNVTEYRLCIHTFSTSTLAYYISFNNFKIWEQSKSYGSIISEWQSYTPTFQGLGSPSEIKVKWRRVGSSLELHGAIKVGNTTADLIRIGLPNGYTTKLDSLSSGEPHVVGYGARDNAGNSSNLTILANDNQNFLGVGFIRSDASINPLTRANGSSVFNPSDDFVFYASVPITGWGGTVQLSSQVGDGRTVIGSYHGHTGVSLTANVTTLKFNNKLKDSHSAYSTSTGVVTIPQAGDYVFMMSEVGITSGDNAITPFVNGSSYNGIYAGILNGSNPNGFAITIPDLKVGDTVDFRSVGNLTTTTRTTSFSFFKINSGSQAFAREEFVGASYYSSANQTSLTTQINFGAKIYDSHNAVTTGSSWKFTAPQNGKYLITGFLQSNGNYGVRLYKNGSIYNYGIVVIPGTSSYNSYSTTIDLLAGEYIDLRPDVSSTWYGNASLSGGYACQLQISKVS